LAKENEINNLVKNFEYLGDVEKRDMVSYLKEFFDAIKDDSRLKDIFINNALNAK
jgi:hypothetical protein